MTPRNIHSLPTILRLNMQGRFSNDRLLFGRSIISRRSALSAITYTFRRSKIFGYVRWRGDEYGTQTWRVVVAQAGQPGERLTRIPGVEPGAHLLLHAFGKGRAKRALRAIDVLSDSHVLHQIAPAYWRHVHLQIAQNLPLEPYDPDMVAKLARAKSAQ